MIKRNLLVEYSKAFFILIVIIFFNAANSKASGISIDAGLTPASNRLIFRTQMRYMERKNVSNSTNNMSMKMYMYPFVVAYGLRSDWTIMVRQAIMRSDMTMMNSNKVTKNGLGDLFLSGKYRLIRINTPGYTFGVAPTLGVELPTGKADFSSDSYDLHFGSYFSARFHSLGVDLNIKYVWNGFSKVNITSFDPGDELSIETAASYVKSLGYNANLSIAVVIESSYMKTYSDYENDVIVDNTEESIFLISPGIKITRSSFIVEGLIQLPVWQDQNNSMTERKTGFLLGIRLMN